MPPAKFATLEKKGYPLRLTASGISSSLIILI
jgi:hypothetical protein